MVFTDHIGLIGPTCQGAFFQGTGGWTGCIVSNNTLYYDEGDNNSAYLLFQGAQIAECRGNRVRKNHRAGGASIRLAFKNDTPASVGLFEGNLATGITVDRTAGVSCQIETSGDNISLYYSGYHPSATDHQVVRHEFASLWAAEIGKFQGVEDPNDAEDREDLRIPR